MKTYRTTTGPFAEKPFFKPEEIEQICRDELTRCDLYPPEPAPIRIDRFVEKRFKVRPSYEDLPPGLLGFTLFGDKGVEQIIVARALDEEGTQPAERRLRTTLAHESGHGLLHAHLFAFGALPEPLFGDGVAADVPKILCRDGGVSGVEAGAVRKAPYRWWEFQANLAMSTLLLPKSLVEQALQSLLIRQGIAANRMLAVDCRERAIRLLSDTFDVNSVVARIRLDGLYPRGFERQLTL